MSLDAYRVVAPKGAVVEEGRNAILYPAGTVFQALSSNASIRRLLSSRAISSVKSELAGPISRALHSNESIQRHLKERGISLTGAEIPASVLTSGITGPVGPRGLPGGPAGSLHSVKIRTPLLRYPISLRDAGTVGIVGWPVNTETLYDEAGMFNRASDSEKIFVKPGGAGRHHVQASIRFNVNPMGARLAEVNHYGSDGVLKDTAANSKLAVTVIDTIVPVACDFNCAAGDYFTLSHRQTSTSSIPSGASFSAMLMGGGLAG